MRAKDNYIWEIPNCYLSAALSDCECVLAEHNYENWLGNIIKIFDQKNVIQYKTYFKKYLYIFVINFLFTVIIGDLTFLLEGC